MQNVNQDTIAAQATPPGRGGISIIRVSGTQVKTVMASLLNVSLMPRTAMHLPFLDAEQQLLDEGIALFFPGPHSFTGEDVLELQGHGGPVIVDLLLQRILSLGVRLARPGEFSERAFLNGKIDLTQAEAIADLIDASSIQAARSAVRSLQGEFSEAIYGINEKITHLRMYVEAAIDFTDEEIDFLGNEKIKTEVDAILHRLIEIQQQAKQGSFLREGIRVVIAGAPNVGKSSLLNCLSGKESAIVTNIPGTTRDVLREHILLDGMPVHIIDTAGLRESSDIVEQEGIRRAQQEIAQADLILYVSDASQPESYGLPTVNPPVPVLMVRNKIDITQELPQAQNDKAHITVSLSVKTGAGLNLLKDTIKQIVGFQAAPEGLFLARRRHLDALFRAEQHVRAAMQQLMLSASGELAAEDLRLAQKALGEITGEMTADDLLGRIFSTFCIGK